MKPTGQSLEKANKIHNKQYVVIEVKHGWDFSPMTKEIEYLTPKQIATKYVHGFHDALTDSQEKKDMEEDIEKCFQGRVNAISDDFKKILEDESDCKGIYLTKGTIRGIEALDAFEIWVNKLLKQ